MFYRYSFWQDISLTTLLLASCKGYVHNGAQWFGLIVFSEMKSSNKQTNKQQQQKQTSDVHIGVQERIDCFLRNEKFEDLVNPDLSTDGKDLSTCATDK